MTTSLQWGILGTGRIANVFAQGLAASQTGHLLAVGSRTSGDAQRFGEKWNVARRYASYEELLADTDVQAIYISTPHPMHAEWAINAADAGKHILCEKPIGLNRYEAVEIIEAARRNDVFLMEGFMYRCHPQIAKLIELLRAGEIGKVRVIQATFSFDAGDNTGSRLLNNDLGGGGILDVGCYCTSLARLVAGIAMGKDFAEPTKLTAVGHIGETGVDEYTLASLSFPSDILAQLFAGVRVNGENVVRISGSKGSILLPSPWTPAVGENTSLILERQGVEDQKLVIEHKTGLYNIEADIVAQYLGARQAPMMTWEDTLGNMRVLDDWRQAVGVVYNKERADGSA